MIRCREITEHLKGLDDIRAILAGMRTLAAVELQRVTRLQDAGEPLRRGLEVAVAAHFAGRPPPPAPDAGVCVLPGSEKGLCGDFNERLLAAAASGAQPRGAGGVQARGHRPAAGGGLRRPAAPPCSPGGGAAAATRRDNL